MSFSAAVCIVASYKSKGTKMPKGFRLLSFLLISYALGLQPASAVVDVQGDAASVQVVARQARLSEVLVSLSQALGIRYETMVNLDSAVDGTYRGPLGDVLARILNGYNYVVSTRDGHTEVTIIDRVGSPVPAVAPTPPQTLPKNTDPAAQWRSEAKKP
jgi:hypothetical protein